MSSFGIVCWQREGDQFGSFFCLVDILITTLQNYHDDNSLDCNQELIKVSGRRITMFPLDCEKSLRDRFTKKMASRKCALQFSRNLCVFSAWFSSSSLRSRLLVLPSRRTLKESSLLLLWILLIKLWFHNLTLLIHNSLISSYLQARWFLFIKHVSYTEIELWSGQRIRP